MSKGSGTAADGPDKSMSEVFYPSPAVAWVDVEPDAIAVVLATRDELGPMLVPEPLAQLWRALARPEGASRGHLMDIVGDEDADAALVVNGFLNAFAGIGLIEPLPTPDVAVPGPADSSALEA